MPVVFFEILKKLAPYLKYIVFGAAIVVLLMLWHSKSNLASKLDQELQLYKRQMAGQLTAKEQELEQEHLNLGLAESKLMEQKDLAKAFEQEKIQVSSEFAAFKKQYKIELESYQRTVASLQEQLKSKNTTVVTANNPREVTDPPPDAQFDHIIDPKKEKIAYDWKSGDGRFELDDPDIFVAGGVKTFTLNQNFRVTGEVYREKVGFLKTQRLTLEEVVPDGKNTDGSAKYKTVGTAKIVDSKFNYTEKSPDSWVPRKGVFGLWGVVSANFGLNNGLNPRFLLGTGLQFLSWKGLGLGLQLYLDTTVWQDSGFGIDLAYRPTIRTAQLNIAVSLGLATQFRQPFQSYIPMLGLKFYLWN
jgi:uncharacterized protein YeaO (DUF488 family)